MGGQLGTPRECATGPTMLVYVAERDGYRRVAAVPEAEGDVVTLSPEGKTVTCMGATSPCDILYVSSVGDTGEGTAELRRRWSRGARSGSGAR